MINSFKKFGKNSFEIRKRAQNIVDLAFYPTIRTV